VNAKRSRAQLLRQISQLPERYQVVMRLHYLEGNSYLTIARLLSRPPGTIKCWISRGNKRLQQLLKDKRTNQSTIQRSQERDDGDCLDRISSSVMAARIARLPKPYRMILWEHYLEKQSYSELSRILKKPIGTIKSLVHRGKKMLLEEEA